MRPWAQWTAKTALLAAGFAALGTIGVGAGAVAVARRRRNSEVYVEPACRPRRQSDTVRGFPLVSLPGKPRTSRYERGVCASGIHALFAWLLLCRLRMCGLGV